MNAYCLLSVKIFLFTLIVLRSLRENDVRNKRQFSMQKRIRTEKLNLMTVLSNKGCLATLSKNNVFLKSK